MILPAKSSTQPSGSTSSKATISQPTCDDGMNPIIMMNSNQMELLNPVEMFERLLGGDFREAICQDESARIHKQRQILLQLIAQYQDQIRQAQIILDQDRLLQLRQRLLQQLQHLRQQREIIHVRLSQEIKALRTRPVYQQGDWTLEMQELRMHNNKLKIRIKQLMAYIAKLEQQNMRLEEKYRVLEVMEHRQVEDRKGQVQALKQEYSSLQMDMRERMRRREEAILRDVKAQQLGIMDRNQRRRAESLAGIRERSSIGLRGNVIGVRERESCYTPVGCMPMDYTSVSHYPSMGYAPVIPRNYEYTSTAVKDKSCANCAEGKPCDKRNHSGPKKDTNQTTLGNRNNVQESPYVRHI